MNTNLSLVKTEQNTLENPEKKVSWEEFLVNPNERMEWVDGKLVEKTRMTFKHGLTQSKLSFFWRTYLNSSGQGGEICTETLCKTKKQARRPDIAYITQALLEEVGSNFTILPQSFPLIAEIASPEDSAEGLFIKAQQGARGLSPLSCSFFQKTTVWLFRSLVSISRSKVNYGK